MNNRNAYLSLFKRVALVLLLLISACQSLQPSTPSELGTLTISPTATKISSVVTDNQSEIDLMPLPQYEDYIFYAKFETNTDYKIWAINPNKLGPIFVTSNFALRGWSPSNKFWLLTGYQSIYVANADGSEIHKIYTFKPEYESIEMFWLTDDVILFNAYKDTISLPPDMYSLDINSGIAAQLFLGSSKFIQVTFPSEKKWLRASWPSGPLDIVDQSGKTEKFIDDFSIPTNTFAPYPPVQRINRLDKYLFKAIGPGDTNSKLWLASKQATPQILFDPGSDGIDQFAVSPDEKYVALTYNTIRLKGVYVYVFSLDNLQLLYQWVYPYKLGAGYFIWSPDSRSIALHYSDSDVSAGIQIMDVTTGETRIILKEDVDEILDWHLIK